MDGYFTGGSRDAAWRPAIASTPAVPRFRRRDSELDPRRQVERLARRDPAEDPDRRRVCVLVDRELAPEDIDCAVRVQRPGCSPAPTAPSGPGAGLSRCAPRDQRSRLAGLLRLVASRARTRRLRPPPAGQVRCARPQASPASSPISSGRGHHHRRAGHDARGRASTRAFSATAPSTACPRRYSAPAASSTSAAGPVTPTSSWRRARPSGSTSSRARSTGQARETHVADMRSLPFAAGQLRLGRRDPVDRARPRPGPDAGRGRAGARARRPRDLRHAKPADVRPAGRDHRPLPLRRVRRRRSSAPCARGSSTTVEVLALAGLAAVHGDPRRRAPRAGSPAGARPAQAAAAGAAPRQAAPLRPPAQRRPGHTSIRARSRSGPRTSRSRRSGSSARSTCSPCATGRARERVRHRGGDRRGTEPRPAAREPPVPADRLDAGDRRAQRVRRPHRHRGVRGLGSPGPVPVGGRLRVRGRRDLLPDLRVPALPAVPHGSPPWRLVPDRLLRQAPGAADRAGVLGRADDLHRGGIRQRRHHLQLVDLLPVRADLQPGQHRARDRRRVDAVHRGDVLRRAAGVRPALRAAGAQARLAAPGRGADRAAGRRLARVPRPLQRVHAGRDRLDARRDVLLVRARDGDRRS